MGKSKTVWNKLTFCANVWTLFFLYFIGFVPEITENVKLLKENTEMSTFKSLCETTQYTRTKEFVVLYNKW
jgi:hypothetical protein